ncbi:tetratricopeptide repeat protein [Candidatus Thorarchaeota archaeon]|nr:MAG: tetratricopeptide repeat protein [Candidatus Thorarchaeota archaeon]
MLDDGIDLDKVPEPKGRDRVKMMLAVGGVVLISGLVIAWLGGQGILPVDPSMVLGITVITTMIIVCCSSAVVTGKIATKIPEYSDMELRFDKAMEHYENEEYDEALAIFRDLMGPERNHKRALYYTARIHEKRNEWDQVKTYCKRYLEMQPRDKEVWELLATAHKRLFEYEAADEALEQASELSG